MKKLSEKQEAELLYSKDYSLSLIDFLSKKKENDSKGNFIYEEMRKVINDCYQQKNLRGIKIVANDIRLWSKDFSTKDQHAFKSFLEKRLSTKTINQNLVSYKEIEKIVHNGKIHNNDEFRIVMEYMNDTENYMKNINIDFLNQMLSDYEVQ